MREWRRTLRSWPKETSRTADLASLPAWARTPLAEDRRSTRDMLSVVGGGLFLPVGVGVVLAVLLEPQVGHRWSAGIVLAALVVSQLTFHLTIAAWSRRRASRRREADLDALREAGEPTLDGEYVGVSYADGFWRCPRGSDGEMDAGVLRLDFDRLTFVGRDTRFAIPARAVTNAELRRYRASDGDQAHLVIHWHDAGRSGTVRLSFLGGSRRTRVEEAMALRDRIEWWRVEPHPRRARATEFPPAVKPQAVVPPRSVGLPAKLLAVPATILLLGIIEAMATGVSILAGWPRTGQLLCWLTMSSWAVWSVLVGVIDRRLPERYRDLGKRSDGARDALLGVAAATETVSPVDEIKLR